MCAQIAPDGDIMLVVGPDCSEIRVHSLFLRAASKTFAAMLQPHWKEGQEILRNAGPVELALPDDNPQAMEHICAVIHHRSDLVPTMLDMDTIIEITILTDKYDLLNLLTYAGRAWLQVQECKDSLLPIAAAYVFQDTRAFKKFTKAMILNYDGSYLALWQNNIESLIPWKTVCLLEEHRTKTRFEILKILLDGVHKSCHTCWCNAQYLQTLSAAYDYLRLLRLKGICPPDSVHLNKAIEIAEGEYDPISHEPVIKCEKGHEYRRPDYRTYVRQRFQDLRDSIGLCLDCLRLDGECPECEFLRSLEDQDQNEEQEQGEDGELDE